MKYAAGMAALLVAAAVSAAEPPAAVNPRLPPAAQAAQLQSRAEQLSAAGKAAEAAALYQQAAELTPDDWVAWDNAGWAHLDNNQAAPALKAFEASRKVAPAGTRAGGLLIAHFALGEKKETLDLLRKDAPPELAAEAERVVERGLAAKQFTPEWNYALGYLYAKVLRNSSRAVVPVEAVTKASPNRAEAWLMLVEINRDLDRGPQEDAAAVKYLELAPETADAYRLRAERHAAVQQYGAAVEEYQAGITKYPDAAELYYQLARVQERTGRAADAEATYRKLIAAAEARKREDLRMQARAQLANLQARRQNYTEAEKFYREAAARPDATFATVGTWGALLALAGKWDQAAGALETAARREEQERGRTAARDEVLADRYHAAVCRLAAGQREQSRSGLKAALALKSDTRSSPEMEAAAFLSWLESRTGSEEPLAYRRTDERWASFTWRREPVEGEVEVRGRYSPAATAWRAILQQVQKVHPDCWPADYALARIYASAGFTEDALALLGRVTQERPDWWAPFYATGQYYAREQDKEKGLPVLRKVVQLAPQCRQARVYLSLLSNLKDDDE